MFVMQAVLPFLAQGLRALLGPRGIFIGLGGTAILLAIGLGLTARARRFDLPGATAP